MPFLLILQVPHIPEEFLAPRAACRVHAASPIYRPWHISGVPVPSYCVITGGSRQVPPANVSADLKVHGAMPQ